MSDAIKSFHGEHRFLSNFWFAAVMLDGEEYPTVEHAYQAAKTLDHDQRMRIKYAPSAGDAKRLGRLVTMRPGWDDMKLSIMRGLVFQKFENNIGLRNALLETGDRLLIEGNAWGDRYWGVSYGEGLNNLGIILMDVRKQLGEAA